MSVKGSHAPLKAASEKNISFKLQQSWLPLARNCASRANYKSKSIHSTDGSLPNEGDVSRLGIFLDFCLFGVSQQAGTGVSQAACSYIKYQVHGVHMQSSFFTHCRPKAQLGYRPVPSSEALYQSQYLLSCINGCCAEPSDSTGHWRHSQGQTEKAPVSVSLVKNTLLIDLPVQVEERRRDVCGQR